MARTHITVSMNELLDRINREQPVHFGEAETAMKCLSAGLITFNSTEAYNYGLTTAGSDALEQYHVKLEVQRRKRAAYSRARNRAMNEVAASLGLTRTRNGWE